MSESDLSNQADAVTALPAPSGASQTVNANDSITVSWTENSNNGYHRVQVSRDGSTFTEPAGGDATPSLGTSPVTYRPASDEPFDAQIGIDSSFVWRVKAETEHTATSWVGTGTAYTEPIPPHNPSVSRPNSNTVEVTYTVKADQATKSVLFYRKDTGGGYSSWSWVGSVDNHGRSATGQTRTQTFSTSSESWMEEDARYQFKIRSENNDANPRKDSGFVYADYGNEGNVYFEDDFESGNLSAWRHTGGSYVSSGSGMDSGFSGADQGTYYAVLDGDAKIDVQLPDLGNESDVIVKAAVAVGSADDAGEELAVDFWDGDNWQQLADFHWEYNKQGWVELTTLVPDAYLGGGDYVRFESEAGGGGDHYYVDRLVVSDILHEYTKPADVTVDSISAGDREISLSWTNPSPWVVTDEVNWHADGTEYKQGFSNRESYTITGLDDGEEYEVFVLHSFDQYRRGSKDSISGHPHYSAGFVTTNLPAPSNLSASNVSESSADLSWTANHNYGNTRVEYKESGAASWTEIATLGNSATSETLTNLLNGEEYDARVVAETEHTETVDQ